MPQHVQHLLPRHNEIMRRLVMGETQRNISVAMGITEARLSVIVNSPLFQLELRKMQRRQEDKVAHIHEKIIEGAEKAIDFHNQVIEGAVAVKDGDETIMVPVGLGARQQSSTAVANLFLRLTRGSALDPSDDEEEPYEARLEKEVTFKETRVIKTRKRETPKGEAIDIPLHDDSLDEQEAAAIGTLVEQSMGVV